jgi:hypothetical protein
MNRRSRGLAPGTSATETAGAADAAAAAAVAAMTADLERLAAQPSPRASSGFADRVFAAIATEPMPVPTAAASRAFRRHSLAGLVAALRDSARVAFGSRRPVAARASAFALLFAAFLMVCSAGGAVAVGAAAILAPAFHSEPHPAPVRISPSTSMSPSPSVRPTSRLEPSEGPAATSSETRGPDATGDQDGSPGSSDSASSPTSDGSHGSGESARPTDADATPTPDTRGGDGSGSGGQHGGGPGH